MDVFPFDILLMIVLCLAVPTRPSVIIRSSTYPIKNEAVMEGYFGDDVTPFHCICMYSTRSNIDNRFIYQIFVGATNVVSACSNGLILLSSYEGLHPFKTRRQKPLLSHDSCLNTPLSGCHRFGPPVLLSVFPIVWETLIRQRIWDFNLKSVLVKSLIIHQNSTSGLSSRILRDVKFCGATCAMVDASSEMVALDDWQYLTSIALKILEVLYGVNEQVLEVW